MSAASRFSWELIEHIISHYDDDLQTLCSFSRTCRQLRPHSLCLMVAKVEIYERKQVAAFRDFLVAFPQYRTFVREILTRASTFMPFPLLHMLPNLTKMHMTHMAQPISPLRVWGMQGPRFASLHPSVLTCYRNVGTRITTLWLSGVFMTLPDLCRVLLAFTGIKRLHCSNVTIEKTLHNNTELQRNMLYLSRRVSLESLHVGAE